MNLIDQIKQPTAPKKASKDKATPVDLPQLHETIEKWHKANQLQKSAKTDCDMCSDEIAATVMQWQAKQADYHQSIRIENAPHSCKVNIDDKWKIADLDKLRELAPNQIETNTTVTLKKGILDDEAKQAELIELFGNRLKEFFDVSETAKIRKGFAEWLHGQTPERQAAIRQTVEQTKPRVMR